MKVHYFDSDKASDEDVLLKMAIRQGYVPDTCLLAGVVVMSEVQKGEDPCNGCEGPREKCKGRDG